MATANQIVSLAISQLGITEQPPNSNKTKYGAWYGMNGEPWCDMFVSWLGAQVGQTDIGKYAYCPYHVDYFKSKGLWLGRTTDTRPGDIVFFGNGSRACHVGIVEKKVNDSTVLTIEGNTSVTSNDNGGAVMRRTRSYGTVGSSWYILGFARPKYQTQGWVKDSLGWWYQNADGTYPADCWRLIDNLWYWFNPAGYAVTGWQRINGKWYWFDGSCAMATGWVQVNGKWYYLNTKEDEGTEGAMRTGWLKKNDNWYYLKPEGDAAQDETITLDGKSWAFDSHCHMYDGIAPDGSLTVSND